MLAAFRYMIAILLAIAVTFGLTYSMQYLITNSSKELNDSSSGHIVDFVRIKREEIIKRKQRKPEKPPQPETPPPEPPLPQIKNDSPSAEKIMLAKIPVATDINMTAGGISLTPGDAEYLPIVKVAPLYPRRALQRGIEGYVLVEFTVTRQGSTRDIKVIESKPSSSLFHSAAIKATAKFKYKPRTVDGKAIEVAGVKNKIIFRLEK